MPRTSGCMEAALPSPVGTRLHFRWLKGIVKWLLPLNLIDGIFTLLWVRTGRADEANVLLRDLVHGDALLFMLVKLTLVSLGAIFLWRLRRRPLAVVAIFVAFFVYYVVLLVHLRYAATHLL